MRFHPLLAAAAATVAGHSVAAEDLLATEPIAVAIVVSAGGVGEPDLAAGVERAVCESIAPEFACAPADDVAAVVRSGDRPGPDLLAQLTEALDIPYAVGVAVYPGESEEEVDIEAYLQVQDRETGIFRSASCAVADTPESAAEVAGGLLRDAEARGLSRGGGGGEGPAASPAGGATGNDNGDGTIDLAVNETLQGTLMAWASTRALQVGDVRAIGPILLLGATAGFAGSLLASHYLDIDQAQAQTVAGGGWWGFADGALLAMAVGEHKNANIWGWSLVGWGVGIGTGITLAATLDLSRGDVALVNSAALWGLFSGAMLGGTILGRDPFTTNTDYDFALPFAGLNVGVATGVLISRWVEVSRGRMALIDLSGLLGTLLGGSLGTPLILDNPSENEKRWYSAIMLGSAALGIGLGALFTAGMDDVPDGVAAAAMIEVGPSGDVDVGVPIPVPIVTPPATEGAAPSVGLLIPVVSGIW